jgi:glycolate oxidase FAD binding subunit
MTSRSVRNWRAVRDVERFAGAPGDVWRISVKPSDAPDIAALAQGEAVFDWGGGLIWVRVARGHGSARAPRRLCGHATLVRASEETRARIAPFPARGRADCRPVGGLRKQFDPRGILNPGLMAPEEADPMLSAVPVALLSAAVFGGLSLMSDRPRGLMRRHL